MTFVFLEEREDSINDGFFIVQMNGYPDLAQTVMVDFPASYHGRAADFASPTVMPRSTNGRTREPTLH